MFVLFQQIIQKLWAMFFFLSPFFTDVDGFSLTVLSQQLKKIVEGSIVEWTSIRRARRWSTFVDIFLFKAENIFSERSDIFIFKHVRMFLYRECT